MWILGGRRAAYFLFLPVLGVAAIALRAGTGPGLVATAISVIGCATLFFEPIGLPWVADPFEVWRLFGLATVSSIVAYACGSLRGAYAREAAERAAALEAAEDLRRQRTQTERAVRLRDETLDVVSHDLRSPLATIASTSELLQRHANPGPDKLRRWGRTLRQAAARIERLIRDLVEVRKLETGQLTLERQPCDAAQLAREAMDELEELARGNSLNFECRLPQALPPLECDRHRILQVLSNLLGNAIHATPPGGTVTLSVDPLEGDLRFSVSDTGCGVDPEDLPHVFERFRRGSRTRYQGSGLGLAIAKGLVEAHGGSIGIESRAGAGTCVWFILPLTPPPCAPLPDRV